MNKSEMFKSAHKIAKETVLAVGNYSIALSLALKELYQSASEERQETKLKEFFNLESKFLVLESRKRIIAGWFEKGFKTEAQNKDALEEQREIKAKSDSVKEKMNSILNEARNWKNIPPVLNFYMV